MAPTETTGGRSEEGFEPGTVELGPRRMLRLFRRRAARYEFPAPILEVLREFFGDLCLARGR